MSLSSKSQSHGSARLAWLTAFSLALALPGLARASEAPSPASVAAAEKALAGKILAPCCWNQTIDIHGSEQSTAIRREIRERLEAGESSEAIEAVMVERYGEKILAVPKGSPLPIVAGVMLFLVALAGASVFFLGSRWKKRGDTVAGETPEAASEATDRERDDLDARLEAELREHV